MMSKKVYHQKVNKIAAFMHNYYDSASSSGAIKEKDERKNTLVLMAALYEMYDIHGVVGLQEEARNIVSCTPSVQETCPKMAVVIEGGIIQGIVSDSPEFFEGIHSCVVDYDTSGQNETTIVSDMINNSETKAICSIEPMSKSAIDIDAIFKQIGDDEDA